MKRATILATLALAGLTTASSARASMVYWQAHAAGGWTNGLPGSERSFDTGWLAGSAGGSAGPAVARAAAGPGGMKVDTSGATPIPAVSAGSGSASYADAQWMDVIRIPGLPTPPATLRLNVLIDGSFAGYTVHPLTGAQVHLGINLVNLASAWQPNVEVQVHAYEDRWEVLETGRDPRLYLRPAPYTDYAFSESVSRLESFEVAYSEADGGYFMSFLASAFTLISGPGNGHADFGHTVRLVGVTHADGSAITGPITFDSGFELNAVPEPSSLTLAGIGAASLALIGLRSRTRKTA
jgi:hypothetical protein